MFQVQPTSQQTPHLPKACPTASGGRCSKSSDEAHPALWRPQKGDSPLRNLLPLGTSLELRHSRVPTNILLPGQPGLPAQR